MTPGAELPASSDLRADLLTLLSSPNVGSKRWIWRQYDHIVRGGTVVLPGADAAVVRVQCQRDTSGALRGGDVVASPIEKVLAFSVDGNGRFVELDPFAGAAMAVAEACRNLVCSGAEPIGLTDCLNFGNPERPEVMHQFARAIDGIAAACDALVVPIVSGNVSLYNETNGRAILPTPTIGAVGLIDSLADVVTPWWKAAGDLIFVLGADAAPLGAGLAGSEYAALLLGSSTAPAWPARCPAPTIDLAFEARLQRLVLDLARAKTITSAHDVSDGGLAVALAECATLAPDLADAIGGRVDLELAHDLVSAPLELASALFGEHPSRVVVTVRAADAKAFAAAAEVAKVPARQLGVTGGTTLSIHINKPHGTGTGALVTSLVSSIEELSNARANALVPIVGP